MIRGYVLIETEVGRTVAVAQLIRQVNSAHARIATVDTVTGPYDVIATLEADDLDGLGRAVTEEIASVEGVQRTTTCLSVNLG